MKVICGVRMNYCSERIVLVGRVFSPFQFVVLAKPSVEKASISYELFL